MAIGVGTIVRVNAPGHAHNTMTGKVLEISEGNVPHIQIDPNDPAGNPVGVYPMKRADAEKVKTKQNHILTWGNIGEEFALVGFSNGQSALYHFPLLVEGG